MGKKQIHANYCNIAHISQMDAILFPDFKNIQGKEVLPLAKDFKMKRI